MLKPQTLKAASSKGSSCYQHWRRQKRVGRALGFLTLTYLNAMYLNNLMSKIWLFAGSSFFQKKSGSPPTPAILNCPVCYQNIALTLLFLRLPKAFERFLDFGLTPPTRRPRPEDVPKDSVFYLPKHQSQLYRQAKTKPRLAEQPFRYQLDPIYCLRKITLMSYEDTKILAHCNDL